MRRFPEYKPDDEKISLWAESYGGHYGPSFMHCMSPADSTEVHEARC